MAPQSVEGWKGRAMASYRGHLMFSSVLGAAYGAAGSWFLNLDWGPAMLGAGVATLAEVCRREFGVPARIANVERRAQG